MRKRAEFVASKVAGCLNKGAVNKGGASYEAVFRWTFFEPIRLVLSREVLVNSAHRASLTRYVYQAFCMMLTAVFAKHIQVGNCEYYAHSVISEYLETGIYECVDFFGAKAKEMQTNDTTWVSACNLEKENLKLIAVKGWESKNHCLVLLNRDPTTLKVAVGQALNSLDVSSLTAEKQDETKADSLITVDLWADSDRAVCAHKSNDGMEKELTLQIKDTTSVNFFVDSEFNRNLTVKEWQLISDCFKVVKELGMQIVDKGDGILEFKAFQKSKKLDENNSNIILNYSSKKEDQFNVEKELREIRKAIDEKIKDLAKFTDPVALINHQAQLVQQGKKHFEQAQYYMAIVNLRFALDLHDNAKAEILLLLMRSLFSIAKHTEICEHAVFMFGITNCYVQRHQLRTARKNNPDNFQLHRDIINNNLKYVEKYSERGCVVM